jgi:hypothetical protein
MRPDYHPPKADAGRVPKLPFFDEQKTDPACSRIGGGGNIFLTTF